MKQTITSTLTPYKLYNKSPEMAPILSLQSLDKAYQGKHKHSRLLYHFLTPHTNTLMNFPVPQTIINNPILPNPPHPHMTETKRVLLTTLFNSLIKKLLHHNTFYSAVPPITP